jgi:hypothetical protein|tara:strand:+ start:58 stop:687 length:630 start_codon:yes stop_codon:yes gene_type:complete
MKKTDAKNKFNLSSVKKNLRLKRLFQYYSDDIKSRDRDFSFRAILKAGYPLDREKLIKKLANAPEYKYIRMDGVSKKDALDEYQYADWWRYIYEMDEKFYSSITQKEHKNILKDIFKGQILPKINSNFKREIFLEFQRDSFALISSKLNKKYYLFYCSRKLENNKKNYEDLGYGDKFHGFSNNQWYLLKIFSKKINKKQLLKIINKNKG